MAKEIPDLVAVARTGTGKGAARQARRNGMVPGVVYGGGVDPLPIQVPFNELLKRLKAGRFKSTLYNLKVDGQDDVRVCLLYTSPSPRDATLSRMPSSA